jgi:hypothetical protein
VRWWELLPEVLLGLGLGVFAVTERSAATSAFSSTKSIALMAVVAMGWIAGRLVLVRYTKWPALRVLVFGAAALGVLKVVVLPAYSDTTVLETLPVATVVTSNTANSAAVPPATSVPPTPVASRAGALRGIDHRASGTATIYLQPDGTSTLGLENIDIQPGPDYDVYVVPRTDADSKRDGTRLDDLRGNRGTQYYVIPTGTTVDQGEWSVLIWCQTFDVPVAGATLRAV